MKRGRALAIAGVVAAALVVRSDVAAAPASAQTTPALVITSMYGRDLFEFYCASCHGRDGKGHGPVAASLKVAPPDLTVLARENGGAFPRARVTASITGEDAPMVASHGVREMPVWGPIFRSLDPGHDRATHVRIDNVVSYIENMQSR